MKKLLILFGLSISINTMGAGIPVKHQTDYVQIGRASSSDQVELFFDVGDGASNPVMSVDKTAKTFDLSKGLRVQGDLSIGDGASGDGSFIVDEGAGASNPELKWDTTANKWKQFDGTTERDIGAGSGGGSDAINVLSESNPSAEDGTINWTYSGTGSFSTTSTSAEVYEGNNSFVNDFNVQSETLKSSEITIKQGLYGQSCQARFFYIGGDDSIDIKATIRNGNDDQVGSQEFILKVATIWTPVDISFLCPNETEIGVDAELANLYLEFEQTGSGNSSSFRFDKVHLGGLIGLVETTLPDVLGFVQDSGTLISQKGDFIQSITYTNGSTPVVVSYKTGSFTVVPVVTGTVDVGTVGGIGGRKIEVFDSSINGFSFVIQNTTPAQTNGYKTNFTVVKQGVDAKQHLTVYKTIPRISENLNTLTAKLVVAGTISEENGNFIDGNCTFGSGQWSCPLVSGVFTSIPHCQITRNDGNGDSVGGILIHPTTSTSVLNFTTWITGGGSAGQHGVNIECTKTGVDFKLPGVQPVWIKQVETSIKNGGIYNVCRINNNGTASLDSGALCSSWMNTPSRTALGRVTLDIKVGVFSSKPVCLVTMDDNSGNRASSLQSLSSTSVTVATTCASSMTSCDIPFYLFCSGER